MLNSNHSHSTWPLYSSEIHPFIWAVQTRKKLRHAITHLSLHCFDTVHVSHVAVATSYRAQRASIWVVWELCARHRTTRAHGPPAAVPLLCVCACTCTALANVVLESVESARAANDSPRGCRQSGAHTRRARGTAHAEARTATTAHSH